MAVSGLNADIVSKWHAGVTALDCGRLLEANDCFTQVQDFSAKIVFNLSTIKLLKGHFSAAYEKLEECLARDNYLAVAHFQLAVVACHLGRLEEAAEKFRLAQENIRNGDFIDYKQLGMSVKLRKDQIQHNIDVVSRRCQQPVNSKALVEELETLPLKLCVFRPAKGLVDNLEKRQFLKEARVVSSVPDVTMPVKAALADVKSSSTPTSPTVTCRWHLGVSSSSTRAGAITPPPSRPPPRLPPGTVAPSLVAKTNKSDSELDRVEQSERAGSGVKELREKFVGGVSQQWSKGGKSEKSGPTGVASLGSSTPARVRAGYGDSNHKNDGLIKPVSNTASSTQLKLTPPNRQAPSLPSSLNGVKPKPARPPPPQPKKP